MRPSATPLDNERLIFSQSDIPESNKVDYHTTATAVVFASVGTLLLGFAGYVTYSRRQKSTLKVCDESLVGEQFIECGSECEVSNISSQRYLW